MRRGTHTQDDAHRRMTAQPNRGSGEVIVLEPASRLSIVGYVHRMLEVICFVTPTGLWRYLGGTSPEVRGSSPGSASHFLPTCTTSRPGLCPRYVCVRSRGYLPPPSAYTASEGPARGQRGAELHGAAVPCVRCVCACCPRSDSRASPRN